MGLRIPDDSLTMVQRVRIDSNDASKDAEMIWMSQPSLNEYVEKWELQQPTKIAESAMGVCYKVGFGAIPAVLKVFTEAGREDEGDGTKALTYFEAQGATRLYRSDEWAQLQEFLPGKTLFQHYIDTGEDAAITEIVGVVKKLHAKRKSPPPEGFRSLRTRFQSLLETKVAESEDAAAIAGELLSSEENVVVLHGDLHHDNIFQSPSRGWLAIDPKGLIGERTYDLANCFYNPIKLQHKLAYRARVERLADTFADRLGYKRERILKFAYAHGHLSAAWMRETGQDAQPTLEIATKIRELL